MLYSGAKNHLLPSGVNHTRGGNRPRIIVIHIMEGWLEPTDRMFHDPHRQASAHFGVGTDGRMFQWVDTNDQAWHAFAANTYSIGVEHAGMAADGLTDDQITATGKLYAWAHRHYPALNLWINKRITGSGIAYHRKYDSWNLNHHSCPGDKAIKQIPAILEVAKAHS